MRADRTLHPEKPGANLFDPFTKQIHKLRLVNRRLPTDCLGRVAVAIVVIFMSDWDQALALRVAICRTQKGVRGGEELIPQRQDVHIGKRIQGL